VKQHFDNLGLPSTANQADVKRAYRKLAMRLHPDRNPDPRAAGLFAELQNSYETLLAFLDPTRPKIAPTVATAKKQKTKEERVAQAKKRYEDQKLREKKANDSYFAQLTKGNKWKIYRVGTVLCTLLSFVLLLDLVLPETQEKDSITGITMKESGGLSTAYVHPIYLENTGKLQIEKGFHSDFQNYPDVYVIKTPIFHLVKEIVHPVEDELKSYTLDWTIFSQIYWVILFFLLPFGIFFYWEKSPRFTFLYHFSLYLIFPLAILFLSQENRWLHLISLGFL